MLDAALQALVNLMAFERLLFLVVGVLVGLVLGVIPGLGGLVGIAILLPFTYDMDPESAIAMLVALGAIGTTSDTITSVLFAVPGTVGSQATILDGHPMARKGEAGRALGAAYLASMLGGLIGAFLLAISIPIMRPLVLAFGSPELFMLGIMGISMVAVLSGRAVRKGIIAAGFGLVIGMVGEDPQLAILRWTFGSLYLWDGVNVIVVGLGLFAIPEIADMVIEGTRIASLAGEKSSGGVRQGMRDVLQHWPLMARCSVLGTWIGVVPGLGSLVVDWIAYGHAKQTCKGASETFGKGDIRGVIAPESANNAKQAGAFVPTLAFGVPGSTVMALYLAAFMIHGVQPGPEMITKHLSLTFTIVWSLVLANVLATGLCLMFTNLLAKIALVPIHVLAPLVTTTVFLAAYEASRHFGDLITLLAFSALGWIMKRCSWPRPPMILAFVLAQILERYLFVSVQAYGAGWLLRPWVAIVLAITLVTVFYGLNQERRARRLASGEQ